MHEVLVNRLGGLSLPRKRVVRLTDRPDITLDVYRGRKTTMQQQQQQNQIDKSSASICVIDDAEMLYIGQTFNNICRRDYVKYF